MLSVNNLACERGGKQLFSGVSFTLRAGEWLHLQGENGAGKTSLLKQLVGLLPSSRGMIRWGGDGSDQSSEATPVVDLEAWHDRLHYLSHATALKADLNAIENLSFELKIKNLEKSFNVIRDALFRVGLAGREMLPVRQLSAGQKRRVTLALLHLRSAATQPAVPFWVLDEPFTSLDSGAIMQVSQAMQNHLEHGGLMVVTSHQPLALTGNKVFGKTLLIKSLS